MGVVQGLPSDDWAETFEDMQRRRLEQQKFEQDMQRRRFDRRTHIWEGVGWLTAAALVIAGVCFLIFLWYRSAEHNGDRSVERERERTAQVRACTDLEQPIDRQYCLLAIGVDVEGNSDGS